MKLLAFGVGGIPITPPTGIRTGGLGILVGIIRNGVLLVLIVIILLALFFLIYGGFTWMTSQGEKAKIESARTTIIYAVVGLFVSLLSFAIIYTVLHFFGLEGLLN